MSKFSSKVLITATLLVLAASVVLVVLKRGESVNGASSDHGKSDVNAASKSDPGSTQKSRPEKDSIEEFIDEMTDEERNAKPKDMEMGEWAHFVYYHREDVKKNGQIEFYGRVVDANGKPLPGVEVEAKVTKYNPSIAEMVKNERKQTTKKISVTTDSGGRFSITDLTGVTLLFQKIGNTTNYHIQGEEGYGFSFVPEGVRSEFDPSHQPQPGDPVVFVVSESLP